MARVQVFLRPVNDNSGRPYLAWDHIEFSRVPSLGEHVALGNDQHNLGAYYVVELVIHCPLSSGADAEIYLRRVDFTSIKGSLGRDGADQGGDWQSDAWPKTRD